MYSLKPWELEQLRTNHFIRLSDGSGFISLDDFHKKHNLSQKLCPKEPDYVRVCERSAHLHVMEMCALEYFSAPT